MRSPLTRRVKGPRPAAQLQGTHYQQLPCRALALCSVTVCCVSTMITLTQHVDVPFCLYDPVAAIVSHAVLTLPVVFCV